MAISTHLIPGTASYAAAQRVEQRQAVQSRMSDTFRALFELSKIDVSPEVSASLVLLARACNALNCD